MANTNLANAKIAKNDEFYTQYPDIQKEMNAYVDYNPHVFRDKTVFLPCDDPEWSNFTKFFAQNFEKFGLKKLISTSYANDKKTDVYVQISLFESNSPQFDKKKTKSHGKIFTLDRDKNKSGRIDIDDLDLTKELDVKKFINEYKPDVVMHNAAWTQVDKAEENQDLVYKINALAPKYIAEACREVNAKMVYISTEYVFDGLGDMPFNVSDLKSGLSVYGKTKAQGEDFVISTIKKYFIVRISWVFGKNGNNFVKTMLKLADMGKTELNVVSDQIGSVTYTHDLAKLLCDMIETDKYGIYHATNEGYISWADFAKEIFKLANKNVKVNPISTEDYLKLVPQQAKRPLNSRMSKESLDKAGFKRLPEWKDALKRYLDELKEN